MQENRPAPPPPSFSPPVPPPPPPPTPPPAPPPPPVSSPIASTVPPASVPPASGSPFKKLAFLFILLVFFTAVAFGLYRFLRGRPAATPEPVTVVYWGLWESEDIMRPLIQEFEQANPGIKIDYRMQSIREYRERLASAISQNKGPDIMRIHASWLPMFVANLAPVPSSVYSTSEYESTFYPVTRDLLKFGQNYYALPIGYEGLTMYVNDDLLSAARLSVPKTWDELRLAAVSLSRCVTDTGSCSPGAKVDVAGVGLGKTANVDHWQEVVSALLVQNNVNLAAPAGPAADDVFAYFASFANRFGVWNLDLPNSTQLFASGRLAIYFAPSWRFFEIKQANHNLRFSLHPIPQLPIDPDRNEKPVAWASFWVEAVNKNSPRAEAAWKFLKYLSSREGQTKFFQSAINNGREFGEAYSRKDMADQLKTHPHLGALIGEANLAKGWYMASSTFDGNNGLNTKLSAAFASAADAGSSAGLSSAVSAILAEYGLAGSAPAR